MGAFDNKRKPRGKPFEKGNKVGHRFARGESGNPGGRPKSDISPSRILEELARIAFLDPRKLFNEQGFPIPIHQLDEDIARAISAFDHEELIAGGKNIGMSKKLKFIHKTQALELLGKYHKLFIDRVEHAGVDGAPIEHTIRFGDGGTSEKS